MKKRLLLRLAYPAAYGSMVAVTSLWFYRLGLEGANPVMVSMLIFIFSLVVTLNVILLYEILNFYEEIMERLRRLVHEVLSDDCGEA